MKLRGDVRDIPLVIAVWVVFLVLAWSVNLPRVLWEIVLQSF